MGNSTFNINNISQNNKTIINIENSNTHGSTFSDKSAEKSEKIFLLKEKPKLFYTVDYNLFENPEEEKKNEGRWSYYENIKFIKAFVNFGKNYKLIQKYICSRNKKQIRSHAQKFFKKFKKLKNNDFDFSDDNIKDFSDIFKLIEANNKTNINNKEYIINTLIALSKNNSKKVERYLDGKNKFNLMNHAIRQRKEDKVEVGIYIMEPRLNNENNINREHFNELSKIIYNNEVEKFLFKNNEINNDISISNINWIEDKIIEKRIIPEEINISNIHGKEQNTKKWKNNYGNLGNVYNKLNPSIKLDDNYLFLSGDSEFLCSDDFLLSDSKELLFVKNMKSPFLNLISKFFSWHHNCIKIYKYLYCTY